MGKEGAIMGSVLEACVDPCKFQDKSQIRWGDSSNGLNFCGFGEEGR